ncbi:hypothetical protein CFC21_026449, partial [Triticum aestivum]
RSRSRRIANTTTTLQQNMS